MIFRIDPATNVAHPLLTVDGWPYGLAYGAEELWATNANLGVVYRIDDVLLESVEQ